ncbi:MAG: VWA domain-containing protein, partial [candidate division Zixibacteria bacterium]|nr:VWA domain-containing protein [candidate division Zixibacteria bacterium]
MFKSHFPRGVHTMSCTHLMVQRVCSTLRHVVPVVAIAMFCAVALVPVSASAQEVWGPPDDPYVPEDRSDLSSSTGDDDDGSQKAGIPQTVDSVNISSIDPSAFPEICTFVEVLDENGDPIPNLDLDSFCVFQDEQKIDSFSVVELQDECVTSIALVLDVSGSMLLSGKIDSLKSAAHQFVDQMDAFDRVALVTFSSCFNVLQSFTSDKALLHTKIDSLNASGRTAA